MIHQRFDSTKRSRWPTFFLQTRKRRALLHRNLLMATPFPFMLRRDLDSIFFTVKRDVAGEDLNVFGLSKEFRDLFKRDAFRLSCLSFTFEQKLERRVGFDGASVPLAG